MKITRDILNVSLVDALLNNQLAVFKSDTIYGIFASALSPEAFKNLSLVRPKSEGKYYIVLASNTYQLKIFGLNATSLKAASKLWPGSITVVMKSENIKFKHLANNNGEIGFRIPDSREIRSLLDSSGPLLAPSCNPEGQPPASNIKEAIDYFGKKIAIYVDSGQISLYQTPSTVIKVSNSELELLREGRVEFSVIKNKLKIDHGKQKICEKKAL